MAIPGEVRATLTMRRAMTQNARQRRLRKKPPKAAQPRGERAFYHKALRDLMREIEAIIMSEVVDRLEEFERSTNIDRPEDSTRQDAPADDVARAAAAARTAVGELVADQRLLATTQDVAQRVSRQNRAQLGKQLTSVIGIDVIAAEPFLAGQVSAFVKDNTRLIQNLATDTVDKVETIVLRGVRAGTRHEVLREQIVKRLGVTRRRAALIARDQVSKLNGELSQLRQTALGLTEYIWRTVGDDAVREAHEDRDGQTFQWSSPPPDGHPGQPVNCRCSPEPVLDPLLT